MNFKSNKIFFIIFIFIISINAITFSYAKNTVKFIHANIVGPSYAYDFVEFEGRVNYKLFLFDNTNGIIDEKNKKMMEKALIDGDSNYVLLSLGVNEQAKNVDLKEFKTILNDFVNDAKNKKKVVFFHTFMEYPASKTTKFKYKTSDYDDILKEVFKENENVIYIDMSMFNDKKFQNVDGLHYSKLWYDELVKKLEDNIKMCDSVLHK